MAHEVSYEKKTIWVTSLSGSSAYVSTAESSLKKTVILKLLVLIVSTPMKGAYAAPIVAQPGCDLHGGAYLTDIAV